MNIKYFLKQFFPRFLCEVECVWCKIWLSYSAAINCASLSLYSVSMLKWSQQYFIVVLSKKYIESMKKILIVFDFYCNFRLLHNKSTCTWTIWYLCLWNDFFHAYSLLVNYFFQWSNRKIIFHGFVVEAFWNVQNKSCIQNIFKIYQKFF